MSQPSNTPAPRYVVCDCQQCGGHIEFDANEFAEENSIVPCPHCGLETKIFIPILQAERVSTQIPSPISSPNYVRREGFFCGGSEPIPTQISAEQPPSEGRSERHPLRNTPKFTDDQIKSVGERQNDDLAVKLYHEGDQDMPMSLDDARRYIADPRFKLMNPETGLRFTPATLEAFIKAKRLQNKIEAALPKKPQTHPPAPEAEQTPFPPPDTEPSALHKHKRVRFPKGARIALSHGQRESPTGKELINLLDEIVRDGVNTDGLVTEEGIRRLNSWLDKKLDSDIPAITFLLQISDRILRAGKVTTSRAFEMHSAIERVLPLSLREEFKKARQDAWVHSPLKPKATEAQLEYIRGLGGTPLSGLNTSEASLLIEKLLEHSTPPSEQSATEKQVQYIRDLGGNPPLGLSKADASLLIPQLQAKQRETFAKQVTPTLRQIMVLRFWNKMDLAQSSRWEVEQWLTQFYNEDQRRRAAWEAFKLDNGDDGSQNNPSRVPIGAGEIYMSRSSATDTAL